MLTPSVSSGEGRGPAMADSNADPAPFGALLLQLRAAARLTQEELAERARLSPKAIAALERGKRRRPRRTTVELLADALALDASARTQLVAAARDTAGAADMGGTRAADGARAAAGAQQDG